MASILDTIDATLDAVRPHCAHCGQPLPEDCPSAWWCSEAHQRAWEAARAGVEPEDAPPFPGDVAVELIPDDMIEEAQSIAQSGWCDLAVIDRVSLVPSEPQDPATITLVGDPVVPAVGDEGERWVCPQSGWYAFGGNPSAAAALAAIDAGQPFLHVRWSEP